MALYSVFKIMALCALFQAAAASSGTAVLALVDEHGHGFELVPELVAGGRQYPPCRVSHSSDGCVSSDTGFYGPIEYYSNNVRCEITQRLAFSGTRPFALDVVVFDVEEHESCDFDSLTVNGKAYCGTTGPQGVTPAAGSKLVWKTDGSITRRGFKICPVSRHSHRATSSGRWHTIWPAHAPLRLASAHCFACCAMHRTDRTRFIVPPQAAIPTFEVVSGSCKVRNECVYSDNYVNHIFWWMRMLGEYSNSQDCVIEQNRPFKLDVRLFDVESHGLCSFDSLTVNGKAYCGTEGPQGVTPDDRLLVWQTDSSVTRAGFTICAAY